MTPNNKPTKTIWATPMDADVPSGAFVSTADYPNKPNGDAIHYTLTDLYAAAIAERDALRQELDGVLKMIGDKQ